MVLISQERNKADICIFLEETSSNNLETEVMYKNMQMNFHFHI